MENIVLSLNGYLFKFVCNLIYFTLAFICHTLLTSFVLGIVAVILFKFASFVASSADLSSWFGSMEPFSSCVWLPQRCTFGAFSVAQLQLLVSASPQTQPNSLLIEARFGSRGVDKIRPSSLSSCNSVWSTPDRSDSANIETSREKDEIRLNVLIARFISYYIRDIAKVVVTQMIITTMN